MLTIILVTKSNVCKKAEASTSKNKNSMIITKDTENIVESIKSNNIKNILPQDTIKIVPNERYKTYNDQNNNTGKLFLIINTEHIVNYFKN